MGSLLRGAGAGALATIPMSVVMALSRSTRRRREQPPRRITARLLRRPPRKMKGPAADTVTGIAHLGFGAAMGAAYTAGASATRLPRRRHPVVGALYGLGVWAVSYQGWVPAIGALPPATRDRPDRPRMMALAHVVFGATLGSLARPAEST